MRRGSCSKVVAGPDTMRGCSSRRVGDPEGGVRLCTDKSSSTFSRPKLSRYPALSSLLGKAPRGSSILKAEPARGPFRSRSFFPAGVPSELMAGRPDVPILAEAKLCARGACRYRRLRGQPCFRASRPDGRRRVVANPRSGRRQCSTIPGVGPFISQLGRQY